MFILNTVKYRTMVWWKAAALMLAETVSLGVRLELSVLRLRSTHYNDSRRFCRSPRHLRALEWWPV